MSEKTGTFKTRIGSKGYIKLSETVNYLVTTSVWMNAQDTNRPKLVIIEYHEDGSGEPVEIHERVFDVFIQTNSNLI